MENDIRENDRYNERKKQIRKMAPGCAQAALAVGGTRGEKPGRIPDSRLLRQRAEAPEEGDLLHLGRRY